MAHSHVSTGCVAGIYTRKPSPADIISGAQFPQDREFFQRQRTTHVQVGPLGLENSVALHNSVRWKDRGFNPKDAAERAILVQTSANWAALLDAGLRLREPIDQDTFRGGRFGENIFLNANSWLPEAVCIGDEFSVHRGGLEQALRLQVASPRCPCGKVDSRIGKTFTQDGVRAHCASTALGGFFVRPIVTGDLAEGDEVKLACRPHPTWTLARVNSLLYGHPTAVMKYEMRSIKATKDHRTEAVLRSEWMGTQAELEELAELKELAVCEYKEVLFCMLGLPGIGRYATRRWVPSKQTLALLGAAGAILVAGVLTFRRQRT
mmetsp:Transcript_59933/g.106624  ORF Transcript_59933/g.106624 Transcript_59933/m.106624 type:complete len:321 (-) Transcript_59933:422-1384(-)|eukprot:CAMPEP_0197662928 /NCGR_PEP_ID=MMETSP1338-20131121/55409_1 /TAXON_ID=43686 ORGANISM="Pelagodinium beii, Strain RCC1491" /NCGR_SAMPLE_ID=MMETSP1338 /ASSEMBLY_ACC=CAM_ASM_000754 /LENGTH=320 /DNA_ID=CAMNT_0043241039 /DNA_START=89 /DNA_END=1051 /DNA_ORIENTATION=+